MHIKTISLLITTFSCFLLCAQTWTLPQGTAVKDNGPRSYRFTVDYYTANAQGEVIRRQRLTGDYTLRLPGNEVLWKNVTEAVANGTTAPFGVPQKREFMEGFRYRNNLASTLKPDFFRGFPPNAVFERNLVWDTGMIEQYGQEFFDHLKLNEPFHVPEDHDVSMPGVGAFHNKDVVLTWVGRSQRNGQDCALVDYHAFFNPLQIANGGIDLKGRSDYWGQIWVSVATKQIEYATLYEQVVGEMKFPDQNAPQPVNVLRMGTFAPLTGQNE